MSTDTRQCLPGRRLSVDGDAHRELCTAVSAANASEPTRKSGFGIRRASECDNDTCSVHSGYSGTSAWDWNDDEEDYESVCTSTNDKLKGLFSLVGGGNKDDSKAEQRDNDTSSVYSGTSTWNWNDDEEDNESVCTSTNDMLKGFFGLTERRSSVHSQAEFQDKTKKLVGCEQLWGDFQSELKQCDFKTDMGARDVLEKFVAEKMPHDDRCCSKEGGEHLPPIFLRRRNNGHDESQDMNRTNSAPYLSIFQQGLSRLDSELGGPERKIRNSGSVSVSGEISSRSAQPPVLDIFHTRSTNSGLAQDSKSHRKVERKKNSSTTIPMSSSREEHHKLRPGDDVQYIVTRFTDIVADQKSRKKKSDYNMSSSTFPQKEIRFVPQKQQESIADEGAGEATVLASIKHLVRHHGHGGLDRRESQRTKSDESNLKSSLVSADPSLFVECGGTTDDFSDDLKSIEDGNINYHGS